MYNTKIIAAYLPQYHEIEENSKWWGKGYTDWVAVKNAKPLYEGHNQPRIPLNNNYYSLDNVDSIKWQAQLARAYGIHGFAIYHYWFSSTQNLLTKPVELLRDNTQININYFLVWDNNSWVNKTWKNVKFSNQWAPKYESKEENGLLAELKYGNEDEWERHYLYLQSFFKDARYIKEDNRPIFGVFAPNNDRKTLLKMCNYLDRRAKSDGYDGILFISASTFRRIRLDMDFRYEPFNVYTIIDYVKRKIKMRNKLKIYDYDSVWRKIIFNAKYLPNDSSIYGAFVRYDDTPRRGNEANIVKGESPEKFYLYFKELLEICKKQNKKYIYLTAWNEWGEGAYLEPDTNDGYTYLEALKKALDSE